MHQKFTPYMSSKTYKKMLGEQHALRRTALAIGLSFIVFFAASWLLSRLINEPVSRLLESAPTIELYDVIYEIYFAVSYILPIAAAFIPIVLLINIPVRVALPIRRTPAKISVPSVMSGLGLSSIGVLLASVLLSFFLSAGLDYDVPQQVIPVSGVGIAMYLFTVSVFPAILEEMLFRGYVLQSLRRFGDTFAVVISSLVFALFHGNLAQLPNAFLMGLFIGLVTVRTGSLVTGAVLHMLNNLLSSVLTVFFTSRVSDALAGVLSLVYVAVCFVIGIIGLAVLLIKDPNFISLKPSNLLLTLGERVRAVFLNPVFLTGIGIALFMCLSRFSVL